MPEANCSLRGCIHRPGFVIECGYDEALARASVGLGWAPLVREGLAVLAGHGRLLQVKEKFAELCLYAVSDGRNRRQNDEMFRALRAIEDRSKTICEQCGAAGGQVVRDGWYRTACPAHAAADGFKPVS